MKHNAKRHNLNRKKKFDSNDMSFPLNYRLTFSFRAEIIYGVHNLSPFFKGPFRSASALWLFCFLCYAFRRYAFLLYACLRYACLRYASALFLFTLWLFPLCLFPLCPFAESACCHSSLDWSIYDLDDFISNTDH